MTFVRKTFYVDEIDGWCQFHQHFTHAFFTDILAPKITKLCFGLLFFGAKILAKKAHVNS
jgi:hypothetical protein